MEKVDQFDEWGIPQYNIPTYEEHKPIKKKDDMFKIMYSALDKKFMPTLDQKKKISGFLFDNILANNENTLDLALIFTTNNIPVNKQYDMVRALLPKCYIPYPRKKNKPQKDIENIIRYYEVNVRIADRYFDLMSDEEKKRINNKYSEGMK